MIAPTKDMVLLLHQLVAQESGGDPGVRDEALLESALAAAFQTFGGKDLHPTKEEKAAALGHALISNHAFVDGISMMNGSAISRQSPAYATPAVMPLSW